ncbi:hypothetical protein [Pararhodospirillum oryzae]|uniref:Uncharacterized protein n=1 Tax=Pararhodospirillum oryzae TaxID=478448 RepID=A0A512H9E1_9PROT|nr:hypothetical protein [Pararhodospirillum oryzae]GEO82073.1 hypothetical protein ROR02_22040 [Pararhodospirillum oryzae]
MNESALSSSPEANDLNALFGMLAKAFSLEAADLARVLEEGLMTLAPGEDPDGRRHVRATLIQDGTRRVVRVYRDALYYEETPAGETPEANQDS